jgi:hypothetical protein
MCQTKDNRLHANTFWCQTISFTEDNLNLCGDHNHNHRKYYALSRPLLCYTNISDCVSAYVSVLSSIEIFPKLFVLVVIKIVQCRVPLSVPSFNRLITLSTRIVHQSITTELPVHTVVSQIEHTEFVQSGTWRKLSTWFLLIKPTKCTNFSNLFVEWNSTCFGQFLCPLSGVFHYTHSNGVCQTGLLTACKQDQDGTQFHPVSKPVWHTPLLCVRWKTSDDGQNCPKHVAFSFQE